jgi:hypothetical protein
MNFDLLRKLEIIWMSQITQPCVTRHFTKSNSYIYDTIRLWAHALNDADNTALCDNSYYKGPFIYLWYLKVVCTCSKRHLLWDMHSSPQFVAADSNTVGSSVLREGGAIWAYGCVNMWALLLGNRCFLVLLCLGTSSCHEVDLRPIHTHYAVPCHSPTVLCPPWKFLILCMKFSCCLLPGTIF